CGLISTPKAAAVWVSSSRVAWGLPRNPNTKVWLNVAPFSGEVRWTKRVVRPASAAVVVKLSRMAWATCGTVVIGTPLAGRHYGGCRNPIMPQALPRCGRLDVNGACGSRHPTGSGHSSRWKEYSRGVAHCHKGVVNVP